jgi:hypothetical protein
MDEETGQQVTQVRPYVMDLNSTNGTHLNGRGGALTHRVSHCCYMEHTGCHQLTRDNCKITL